MTLKVELKDGNYIFHEVKKVEYYDGVLYIFYTIDDEMPSPIYLDSEEKDIRKIKLDGEILFDRTLRDLGLEQEK